jgi:hypothetical protein
VRQAITLLVEVMPDGEDLSSPLAMVCAELLENAVKYGRRDQHGVRLVVREEPARVVIAVTNAVVEGSPHLAALCDRLSWMHRFGDPAAAFLAAVEAVYEGSDPFAGEGGLGLVRAEHEGGCRLECDVSLAGWVTVRAVRPRGGA